MTGQTLSADVGRLELEAARLMLARMGIDSADLLTGATGRAPAPTFAEYVPVVSATVSESSRRAYNSYWKKIVEKWGERRPDEPSPSEVKQLGEHIRTTVVVRSNSRGGRSAVENFITALRCLYNQAVADNLIAEADNPARKVAKPRRLKSTRHAVPDARLVDINEVAATTGNDPERAVTPAGASRLRRGRPRPATRTGHWPGEVARPLHLVQRW